MKKLVNIFSRIIVSGILIFTGLIVFISVTMEKKIRFNNSNLWRILLILFVFLLFLLVMQIFHWLKACSERMLFAFYFICVAFAGCVSWVLLHSIYSIQVTDSAKLVDQAIIFAKEGIGPDFISERYQTYFKMYGNNYFFTIILSIFYRILYAFNVKNVLFPSFILNMIAIWLGVVFAVLTAIRIRGSRCGAKVLLLCVLNPIFYLMAFMIYTNSFSLPFMTGVVFFAVCIYKSDSNAKIILYSVIEAVFVAAGYFIRATVLIPVIALIISYIMLLIRKKDNFRRILPGFFVFVLASSLIFQGIQIKNTEYFGKNENENFPITHWIMMGSHGDGQYCHSDKEYTLSVTGKQERVKANLNKLKENITQAGPAGVAHLFIKKLGITWSDGYKSMNRRIGQSEKFNTLYRYLLGDKKDLFVLYCFAYSILIYLLIISSSLFYICTKRKSFYLFFMQLVFFGGIVFYTFWEVKNIYSVPFMPFLILIAEYGGSELDFELQEILCKFRRLYKYFAMIYIVGVLVVCGKLFISLSSNSVSLRNNTINSCIPNEITYIDKEVSKGGEILQSYFMSNKPINKLKFVIRCVTQPEKVKKEEYEINLLNSKKEIIRQMIVGKDNIKYNQNENRYFLTVSFEDVKPEASGCQMFIQIKKLGKKPASFVFGYLNRQVDIYRGECWVNKSLQDHDIYLQVYQNYKSSVFSVKGALFVSIVSAITAIILFLLFNYSYGFIRCGRKEPVLTNKE
ncbi:MAG: hypothetical protein PUI16_09680 [Clostridia bacterium]|nr:hypothetical protein [Clostridia bacterium]MDY5554575.1 hypothetical protein [Blautia sp.]